MAAVVHDIVGLQHASMAIFNAFCDRVPVLVLGAHRPDGRDAAAALDRLDPHRARAGHPGPRLRQAGRPAGERRPRFPRRFLRAWRIAGTEPQGPVYLCLDAALQEQPLERPSRCPTSRAFAPRRRRTPTRRRSTTSPAGWSEARVPVIVVESLGRRPGVTRDALPSGRAARGARSSTCPSSRRGVRASRPSSARHERRASTRWCARPTSSWPSTCRTS